MSIAPLLKATFVGHVADKEELLRELQQLGCLHLIPLTPEGLPAEAGGPSREAREALQFLASAPSRRRQMRDPSRFDAVEVERSALALQRRLFELRDERDRLEQRLRALEPWGEFEFPPLEALAGQRLWLYAVPHHRLDAVRESGLRWRIVRSDRRFAYVAVVAEREPEADAMPVQRVSAGRRSPRVLRERLDEVLSEIEDVEAERFALTRWCSLFARALDGLDDRAARQAAAAQTARAEPVFALQGWLPERRSAELRSWAGDRGLWLELSPPQPDEQPPTLFRNAPPLRAGEDLVTFYLTPSYWLWDPSPAVFLSFTLFFAMILADAGYALVLGGLLLAGWRRLGGSAAGRRWRVLLACLAGATGLYGTLAGSYFGLSPPPDSLAGRLELFDLADFETMMALSVAIGSAHVVYGCLRDAIARRSLVASLPSVGWALAVAGGFVAWLAWQRELPTLSGIGWLGLGLGLALVLAFAGAGQGPWMRLLRGLGALTGVTGAFGDVLSYMRLFALGLASASLASAFNGMAADLRQAVPGAGLGLALLVLLLGHSLNFVLSLSSAFIHGLRLNVIEFFKWGVKDEGFAYRAFERKETAP